MKDSLTYMPGNHIYNVKDLETFIEIVSNGIDLFKEERHRVSTIMNGFIKPPLDCCKKLVELYYHN